MTIQLSIEPSLSQVTAIEQNFLVLFIQPWLKMALRFKYFNETQVCDYSNENY